MTGFGGKDDFKDESSDVSCKTVISDGADVTFCGGVFHGSDRKISVNQSISQSIKQSVMNFRVA